jgi:hypothetical protein
MTDFVEIKGGAGEFEAAVIAAVIDRITRDENAARQWRGGHGPGLPAWVRAVQPEEPGHPREIVWPE